MWRWTLRFILPVVALLLGLELYWIWFDRSVATNWKSIVGTVCLLPTDVWVLFWSVGAWLEVDAEQPNAIHNTLRR